MKNYTLDKNLGIMIVGEGGQGVQTIAKVLSKAAFLSGYQSTYIPNFGTEQRGGVSISFVQISPETIISPKFNTADLFVIVNGRNIDRTLRYIDSKTEVIYDQSLIKKTTVKKITEKSKNIHPIDAFKTAAEQLNERSFNIIILGILCGIIDPNIENQIKNIMNNKFAKYYRKNPRLKKQNNQALSIGINSVTTES